MDKSSRDKTIGIRGAPGVQRSPAAGVATSPKESTVLRRGPAAAALGWVFALAVKTRRTGHDLRHFMPSGGGGSP